MSQHGEPSRKCPADARGRSVVLLGATGFVGRHVSRAFRAAGARVHGIARRAVPAEAGCLPVPLDLTAVAPARLAEVLAGAAPDVVVNAAGAVWGVTDRQMWQSNAELPAAVLDAVGHLAVPPRVVHLGSVHEYGPGPHGVAVREDLASAPVTLYGRTKLAGSRAVLEAARRRDVEGVVLRVSNVSGPGAPVGSLLGMIAAHLARAAQAWPAVPPAPLRLTPLRSERDFVDVRDVADAVVAAACADLGGRHGEVVNIGGGAATPVRSLVERLVDLSGLPVDLIEEDRDGAQRGAVDWQQVDIAKAGALLGWQPFYDLDTSLRDLLCHALLPPEGSGGPA